jgi:hypothetical protein
VGQIVGTDWIIAKSSIKSMDDGGEGSATGAQGALWKRFGKESAQMRLMPMPSVLLFGII